MLGLFIIEFLAMGIVAPVLALNSSDYTESMYYLCDTVVGDVSEEMRCFYGERK